jgi:hypothetical protein
VPGVYLRTNKRRNRDGTEVRYLQLAHNVWDADRKYARAEVVYSFGREDQLDRAALERLARSICRFLDPDQALTATAGAELRFCSSRPYGGAYLLDQLWRHLGIDAAIGRAAGGRRLHSRIERVLFTLVANRALAPRSKLGATEWASCDVALPNVPDLGADPQVFYRAMDFLITTDTKIQEEVFFAVANLLNLEVDVVLFDTTNTYFETEEADEFRRYGKSKDRRDDLPQVVIGMAVTKDGIPVRVWAFPGATSDQKIIRAVHDDLGTWNLNRVLWIGDAGFASEDNRTYLQRGGGQVLFAEKLRSGNANHEALARPGRYRTVADNLQVKEVWVGEGVSARRFVICRNQFEATRDAERRARHLAQLTEELQAIAGKDGDDKLAAEGRLLAHPWLRRYLHRHQGRLAISKAKVDAEARLDGKFLLSCTDAHIDAADLARLYKGLLEVEACWRDLKQVIELRPVHHRLEDRIRAHVTLCFLALMLARVAEHATGCTWARIRTECDRMHLGVFDGPAGRVTQRTATTSAQRAIFQALKIKEPPVVLDVTAPKLRSARKTSA